MGKAVAPLNQLLPNLGSSKKPFLCPEDFFACSPQVSPLLSPLSSSLGVFPGPDPKAYLICNSPASWLKFWELERGSRGGY